MAKQQQKETHPFGANPTALFRCSCGAGFAVNRWMFTEQAGGHVHCTNRLYGKCNKVYAVDYLHDLAKRAQNIYDIQLQDLEGRNVEQQEQAKQRTVRRWNDE